MGVSKNVVLMPKRQIIPYNPKLKERARELRKNMTDAERKLWTSIRRKQLNNFQFLRQRPIGNFIVDFYCPEANLVIEVDGGQHFTEEGQESDQSRDAFLKGLGLHVLRFNNHEVLKNIEGVVGDIIYTGPERERFPVAYYSTRERRFGSAAMVRTTGDPDAAIRMIQEELFALDPTVAMSNIASVDKLISRSVGDSGLIFWLLAVFASITVLLAAVGTWGVVAYSVAARQRELGLRIALGAEGTRVLRLVLRNSTLTALVGVFVGLAGAWAGRRLLESFIWNTSAHDPRVYLGGGVLLFAVVLLASYLPALRATRVDPVEVLKTAE